jgi:bacteriorhodopsin
VIVPQWAGQVLLEKKVTFLGVFGLIRALRLFAAERSSLSVGIQPISLAFDWLKVIFIKMSAQRIVFACVLAMASAASSDAVTPVGEVNELVLSENGQKIVWAGFFGVAVPAFYFAYTTLSIPDGHKKFHIVTTFICVFASLAYLTMATGHGVYTRAFDGREFFYARYIDWAFTTPLMLIDLLGFAGASADTTNFLLGVDVLMIISGLIASFFEGQEKYYFWGFGMLMFAPIVYYLNALKKSDAFTNNEKIGALYGKLSSLTIFTWCCYPIVWLLAEGSGKISADKEALCYTVLDVLAKSVFGFLIISARPHDYDVSAPSTTSTAAAAAPAPAPTPAANTDGGSML